MKSCQKHWDQLRKAIEDKGLGHLVSKNGKQVAERLKKELKDEHTIDDPLMSAWFAIMNNALESGGAYLLVMDENGNHYCPMCEGNKHVGKGTDDWFITNSVNEQFNKAKKAGLLNDN